MSSQASVLLYWVPMCREGLTYLTASLEPVCQHKQVRHKQTCPEGKADDVCSTPELLGQMPVVPKSAQSSSCCWVGALGLVWPLPGGLRATRCCSVLEHLLQAAPWLPGLTYTEQQLFSPA